jgi:hypothetical protein
VIDLYETTATCDQCSASTWELAGEFAPAKGPPQDVIECAFCGYRLRVNASRRPRSAPLAAPAEGDFRLQHGRFAGMTLAEVDAEANGRRYLEVLRETNEKLRSRVAAYLDRVDT